MEFYDELIYQELGRFMIEHFEPAKFDYHNIIQTKAIHIVQEIQEVLKQTDLEDFYKVEQVVCIFEKYGLDTGGCHDFR
ncbi:hypothetical protein [Candidatus Soleaferrea massiliensis]|uniref:hypothetical protein n=1 Tax=Candidatus Soleaferrea massiliensis TaxID=1470354 RepID=UPI00058CCA88|nr:hypothetical protein [Candidatus Soleaferrea massiliensis]